MLKTAARPAKALHLSYLIKFTKYVVSSSGVRFLRKFLILPILAYLLLFATPAQANHTPNPIQGPPSPQPCENAIYKLEHLTDNYLSNGDGDGFITQEFTASGAVGSTVGTTVNKSFTVDFSKLQALFGATNSDFLEGNFQEEEHRLANLNNLSPQDFNQYHGAGQKAVPKSIVDGMKRGYVNYIYDHPHLPESSHLYTDTKGQNPSTIHDLVQSGFPQDPQPPPVGATDAQRQGWLNTWGRYWEKIPTSYSEFYQGELQFRRAIGDIELRWAKDELTDEEKAQYNISGINCLDLIGRPRIFFVMPEFKRTVSITDTLNQVVVPCEAQSFRHAGPSFPESDNCDRETQVLGESTSSSDKNLLSKTVDFCLNLLSTPKKVIDKIKETSKTSLEILNPVKVAQAADNAGLGVDCFATLPNESKKGAAPFCAIPQSSVSPGDFCTNPYVDHPLHLNPQQSNNVVCTFVVVFSVSLTIDPNSHVWDECTPLGGSNYECSTTIHIFPNFQIPFLAEIWNNTLYSDEGEGGIISNQETGRPGIYSRFTPQAVSDKLFPTEAQQALDKIYECMPGYPDDTTIGNPLACFQISQALLSCVLDAALSGNIQEELAKCTASELAKNLPGQATESEDIKERFIGAVDCSKFFVRDISLKPIALQKHLGITEQDCASQVAQGPDVIENPGGNPPPGGPPPGGTGPDCDGKYTSVNSPQGNFGDPNCDYSISELYTYLILNAPPGPAPIVGTADWWFFTIIPCESNYQPNAWLTGDPNEPFHSPDPNGAWGLYQIGSTGLANGNYDFGNVEWKQQTNNAFGLLNDNGTGYWACAQ